jgi:hypothetical protein
MSPALEPGVIVEEVFFEAAGHRLQAELVYPENDRALGAAVIAGPHPLLGGNMGNNVVTGVGDGLARRNVVTLRFNYRGVGRSEGPRMDVASHLAEFWATSHVADEMDLRQDVDGALAWLRNAAGDLPMALIGYSFGCALLPFVADRLPLALIAPTIARHSYDRFRTASSPLLVVASDDDFACTADGVNDWFGRLPEPKRLILRRLDNHFFRGHEAWLAETTRAFLQDQWK